MFAPSNSLFYKSYSNLLKWRIVWGTRKVLFCILIAENGSPSWEAGPQESLRVSLYLQSSGCPMVKTQGWHHGSSATQMWAQVKRMLLGGKIIQVISEWAIDGTNVIDNEKSQSQRDKWVSSEFAVETACSLLLLKYLKKKEISWSTHTKFGTENHVKCRSKATYILYFQCTHV